MKDIEYRYIKHLHSPNRYKRTCTAFDRAQSVFIVKGIKAFNSRQRKR